ncbi:hypothetical protein N7533_006525 [Penicillium manginii]|uniref:uncharacterized protein n=1 Tax=Penicillium manginii TaxID=203109 RepID=UPI0025470754|nr:uncharacterized protein N7533_006525 [Penicillium manginii]KAJ5749497.1 hypothetical protein N7533_006525 [Penicillium manginii]
MTLTSNEKRAQRRQECRDALVAHIYERRELKVPPNLVRLQPCPKDGYVWSAAEGFEHLLATNLSSGSVGVYDNIIASLGRSLEAVDPRSLMPDCTDSDSDQATKALPSPNPVPQTEDGSFTATIRRLECENKKLADELDRGKSHSDALLEKVEEWETWAQVMEEQLTESQSLVNQLDEELRHVQDGMAEAVRLLQSFRQDTQSCYSESEDPFRDETRSPSLAQ